MLLLLLSEITSGQPESFLTVQENDPTSTATWQVVLFDLIDYTSGTVTIPGNFSNVPLNKNWRYHSCYNHHPYI